MKSAFHYILVAEDDEDDQRLFIKHFAEAAPDASVKFFKDGNEVLSFLEKCPSYQLPKVLLLDYRMPILDGNQVLKIITGNPRYNAIRKFVWSTSDNPDHVSECTAHGAERYFKKPNTLHELAEIIGVISTAYNGKA
ncbi:MAG TPA: response regulator [Puia sp.]|nr:response regulator [Puia sp.]